MQAMSGFLWYMWALSQPPEPPPPPPPQTYVVTAYTAGYESTGKTPNDPSYGITTSGEYVQEGVTIACPRDMEYGTVLHIEGVGERTCQDRGGAIKGNRLDVYISDLDDALVFGRQELKVTKLN